MFPNLCPVTLFLFCFIIGHYQVYAAFTVESCPNPLQGESCTMKCISTTARTDIQWRIPVNTFTVQFATCSDPHVKAPSYSLNCTTNGLEFWLTFTAIRTRDKGPWKCGDGFGTDSLEKPLDINVPPRGSLATSRLVQSETGFFNCTTDATIPAVTGGVITVDGISIDTTMGTTTSVQDLFEVAFNASKAMPASGAHVAVACNVTYNGNSITIASKNFELNPGTTTEKSLGVSTSTVTSTMSSTNSTTMDNKTVPSPNTGIIAGAVVGGTVVLICIVVIVIVCVRNADSRSKSKKLSGSSSNSKMQQSSNL